jgi:hypothetical protein
VAFNALSCIQTSYGEFTVASAIALHKRLKGSGIYKHEGAFEDSLISQMEGQYQKQVNYADMKNKGLESQAESMRLSILGKDSREKDAKPLEVVDAYILENTTEVIDPLECQKKVQELKDRIDSLSRELDTKIKVSNAATMIEF